MRRPVLLMFVLSLCMIVKVHCNESTGSILNKMNDLSNEITTEMQTMDQNASNAVAEVPEGESERSQIISVVRQLKRENHLMKKQLRLMQNIQKEKDENKKQSREIKCVIYPEETRRESQVCNNFTHSNLLMDLAISNLSLQIQTVMTSQDSLTSSVRNDLLAARSEVKTVQTSVNATQEEVILTKANLTELEDSLEAAQQDILSTKFTIEAVNTSVSDLWQKMMVTTSAFRAMEERIIQLEKALKTAIDSECYEDGHCVLIPNAVCNEGRCTCNIGYSLDVNQRRCRSNTDCNDFGTSFTSFNKRAITDYDEVIEDGLSTEECQKRCVSSNDFTCKAFEYTALKSRCYLNIVSWFDVPTTSHNTDERVVYWNRDCNW